MAFPEQEKPIKLLGPSYSEEELAAVKRVLESGWWGLGPETERFEEEFAEFVSAKYAVAVNSCTAALHLAMHLIEKRGEVIAPAFTFISPALVALYEGKRVVFADIDEKTLCLDPEDVKRRISKETVAIIPVHYAGNLAEIDYGNTDIPIIEDCAHAAGTNGAGKKGVFACWSFHAVKNIATGDGGMVTTNDNEAAQRLKKLRWFGIDLSTWERARTKRYNWEYDIQEIGYKYHLNDIMSAIGRTQLRRINELNGRRKQIAQMYNEKLTDLPVILPPESGSWHLYVIRVEEEYRDKLIDFLREGRISTSVHYKPLYYYPIFNWDIREKGKELPVTEKLWRQAISLPMYPGLKDSEQERVISAIKKFFGAN